MTLEKFLHDHQITEAAFAAQLGVSQVTVHRYVKGQRFPDKDTILRIERITEGKVPPAAWFAPAQEPAQ